MDCIMELTPIICISMINLISNKFSVNIQSIYTTNRASTFQMVHQESQTCELYVGSLMHTLAARILPQKLRVYFMD